MHQPKNRIRCKINVTDDSNKEKGVINRYWLRREGGNIVEESTHYVKRVCIGKRGING